MDLRIATPMNPVESPCINVCRYDSKGMCYGCKRTLEEIGNWSRYTDEQKKAVWEKLHGRKNAEEMPGFAF